MYERYAYPYTRNGTRYMLSVALTHSTFSETQKLEYSSEIINFTVLQPEFHTMNILGGRAAGNGTSSAQTGRRVESR